QWSEEFSASPETISTLLVDRAKGRRVRKLELRAQDGRLLDGADTMLKPNPRPNAAGGVDIRVPDAMRREVPLRRAGTHPLGWTPDQQHTAKGRCAASGERRKAKALTTASACRAVADIPSLRVRPSAANGRACRGRGCAPAARVPRRSRL